jgi:hypothetical protein
MVFGAAHNSISAQGSVQAALSIFRPPGQNKNMSCWGRGRADETNDLGMLHGRIVSEATDRELTLHSIDD